MHPKVLSPFPASGKYRNNRVPRVSINRTELPEEEAGCGISLRLGHRNNECLLRGRTHYMHLQPWEVGTLGVPIADEAKGTMSIVTSPGWHPSPSWKETGWDLAPVRLAPLSP